MKHIVMFSGGIGSWMTAKRVAERYGTENLVLLFADVKGNTDEEHVGEDADTYRFIGDAARSVGGELVFVEDGRSIWEIFKDDRFLGNSRLANCSKYGKQDRTSRWRGGDAFRSSRYPRTPSYRRGRSSRRAISGKESLVQERWLGEWCFRLVWQQQMIQACTDDGITPPRLYSKGYPHNNCGGFCVRAGHAQFRLLLTENPERYRFHERKEQELREYLGKDVGILRDRTGGTSVPLTLRSFRERVEVGGQGELFDPFDFGGCGCFTEVAS